MATRPGGKRIAVLFTSLGGANADALDMAAKAEDLTENAQAVAKSLREKGHCVQSFAFGDDLVSLTAALMKFRPDVVFNLAEGPLACYEKEPHAAAWLELLRLPYTGNGPAPLVLCKHKAITKQVLQAHGIATPRFCVCASIPRQTPTLRFPLVVKPLRQDGSIGITEQSVVSTARELKKAVAYVLEMHQQEALVEEFVGGRELNVSVLGNGSADKPYLILPPGEFVYHSEQWRVCTFEAKWDPDHPSYAAVEAVYPATLSRTLHRQLEKLSVACARIFELSGYSRIDFRLDAAGSPHVLDLNPNPDIAPHMGIARAAETGGLTYPEFVEELLQLGLAKGQR